MAMLELTQDDPDWLGALSVALTRPPGVPERRAGEDPWAPDTTGRPRRIADDLAWFRVALDDPAAAGLAPLPASAAVSTWEAADDDVTAKLARLRDRGVLGAAGFLLHDDGPAPLV
ncbi:hypothetical protein GKE82_19125 [Conexibacter sp. W3-3-2]|uniref:hypothetical protein n=1 Tax=Conexibacter sp. W3-3-2 TaxID=2675227 RepID=UPI0012B90BEC|nr:hypothetical protein [Conexibacter sp. W3-3-2]MTD46341.1 hypothetical protein [Conexibacter sp. W3-3-2]